MNILRRILGGERTTAYKARLDRAEKPAPSLAQQIIEAPALFNRGTRRSIGLYGRFWKWDLNSSAETRRQFVPRYIRRHYTSAVPRTRRERRHRAVVLRIINKTGLV